MKTSLLSPEAQCTEWHYTLPGGTLHTNHLGELSWGHCEGQTAGGALWAEDSHPWERPENRFRICLGNSFRSVGQKSLPATGTLLSLCWMPWKFQEMSALMGRAGPHTDRLVTGHDKCTTRVGRSKKTKSPARSTDFRSCWLASHAAGFPGRPVLQT